MVLGSDKRSSNKPLGEFLCSSWPFRKRTVGCYFIRISAAHLLFIGRCLYCVHFNVLYLFMTPIGPIFHLVQEICRFVMACILDDVILSHAWTK